MPPKFDPNEIKVKKKTTIYNNANEQKFFQHVIKSAIKYCYKIEREK